MYNKDVKKMTKKEVETHLLKEAISKIKVKMVMPLRYEVAYYDNQGNHVVEDRDSKVFSYEHYYMGADGKEQYIIEFNIDFKTGQLKFQDKDRVALGMLKAIEKNYKGEE